MSWRKLTAFVFILCCVGAPLGRAQISIWLGNGLTGTGNWSSNLFWDILPVSGGNVFINNLIFPAVVTLDVNATVNQLTLGTGASLTIANGTALQLNGNSVINGSLTMSATAGLAELVVGSGSVALSGSGSITMSANANNRIRGATVNDGLINQTTIQGSGSIGNGSTGITNQGTIIANNQTVPLVITPNASGATNTGLLRATSNATLTLQSGAFANSGGTIEAQAGSKVAISNATITAGNLTTVGTGTIELAGATIAGANITNSANGIIRALSGINTLYGNYTDSATSQVRINNGARIVLPAGGAALTLNGGIFLDSTGTNTTVEIATTGLAINGTGRLVLSDNANNRILGGIPSAAVTIGPNLTVQGAGQLGGGTLGMTNQGTIQADQSNFLTVQPSSLGFANSGTLRSTAGSTLILQNGTFTNTLGGTIVADSASHIDVSGSTIVGGLLTSIGTGHFHALNSAVFSGVTITAGSTVEVGDAHALTLVGSITNNGVISMLSAGGLTELKMSGAVTLNGTGNITMSNANNDRIHGPAGSSLTVGPAQTIIGAGDIGRDTMSLTNQGTITANRTTALTINNSGTSFTNDGTLKATGPGGLTLSDATVTNLGTIEVSTGSLINIPGAYTQSANSGLTKLAGGTFTTGSFALQDGILSGTGTLNGPVTVSGDAAIMPGGSASIGTLTFNSTLSLGVGSSLLFELGGMTPGTGHDRINGTNIALNGLLSLSFTSGFQSALPAGSTLTLMSTSAALSGTFVSLPHGSRLNTSDGFGSFQVNYLSNALTISNFQPIPEPSTYVLVGIGVMGLLFAESRRRRKR